MSDIDGYIAGMDESTREKHLLDLFIQPGWKVLISDMQDAHKMLIETAYTVKDERELYKRKGEIQKLTELLSLESMIKMKIEQSLGHKMDQQSDD